MLENLKNVDLSLLPEAFLIPLITIFIGAGAKKLARGSGWERSDFFFGIELTLSAISGALTLLFDSSFNSGNNGKVGLFLAISFGFFIYVLGLHQDYRSGTPKQQYVWLTFVSNIIGIGLMASLIFWVRS